MSNPSEKFISDYRQRTSALLRNAVDQQRINAASAKLGDRLVEAMNYSLTNGGKRMRPLLCFASALAVNSVSTTTDAFAVALECIHAYSLIHDDLPAMDDDNLRRGKPTCHVAFDEATAILAGDALQSLAYEVICADEDIDAQTALEGIRILSHASGAKGMVLGQAIDLSAVNGSLSLEDMSYMHSRKTGALIEASVRLGALSAKASKTQTESLGDFAQKIGLAFQVRDDIIDITSDTETLGKPQGSDKNSNKPTYVSLLGLETAEQKAQNLLRSGLENLDVFGRSADHLRALAQLVVTRSH